MVLNAGSITGESPACVCPARVPFGLQWHPSSWLRSRAHDPVPFPPSGRRNPHVLSPGWWSSQQGDVGTVRRGHELSSSPCRGFTADWCLGLPGHPPVGIALCALALLWASGVIRLFPCCLGDRLGSEVHLLSRLAVQYDTAL